MGEDNVPFESTDYRVVGTRPPRADASEKVIGRALFAADRDLPGMILWKIH